MTKTADFTGENLQFLQNKGQGIRAEGRGSLNAKCKVATEATGNRK